MEIGTVKLVKIEDEMKSSYLDYAMSVIVSRALPDARDGLKPVQRRILYALNDMGLRHDTPYKKSARIVGEVLGKYHPHGDTAVYDAMVRMAQDFSMRYQLVDGQGNFGSVDNDPPAAMRYTEARLSRIAAEMLVDIDKDTVDFTPNFDESLKEPIVLPAKLPNLLLNGASGIAVGMATNIPPHNLGELCDGITCLIDNPDATIDDLMELIPGPDFPTGGVLEGIEGIRTAYTTGHGRMIIRARTHIEEATRGGRYRIVVSELPFQTNKATLVERIADLVRNKKIDGISEVRDESDREGMRIVIELKREGQAQQVLNNLYKHTSMQSSFFVNMLALVDGQPKMKTLKGALLHYIDFRRQVVTRRSRFDLEKAKERAHILEGFKIALDNLNEVIATIRKSQTVEAARNNLMKQFDLSQVQAQAILEMQLRRLAALERKKIADEYAELLKTIAYLEDLLANPKKIDFLIKEEVGELKSKYSDPRRTEISGEEIMDFSDDDLIPRQQMVVTLSRRGYIKRVATDTYRQQHRGGRGVVGMVTREMDDVWRMLIASTHQNLLFFTDRGRVFRLKCYEIPRETSRTAKGIPIVNLISIDTKERVTAVITAPESVQDKFMVVATLKGEVKKTSLSEFASVRSSGLIAMDLEPGDVLVSAQVANADDHVLLVTKHGQSIKFSVAKLRTASRTSGGVRGIRLAQGDSVVGMEIAVPDGLVLVVSSKGFGKRTPFKAYPLQHRGGGGVRTFKVVDKTGEVISARVVELSDELMLISAKGIVIRTTVESIPVQGRDTQGVAIMRVEPGDSVASIGCLSKE
ncbi:MAG: DNA gyrase subunit A [Dehalococcoidia bacterium]|nr:MAG: DNA gyrase subunit A [Dehalococcoidia bacterium]